MLCVRAVLIVVVLAFGPGGALVGSARAIETEKREADTAELDGVEPVEVRVYTNDDLPALPPSTGTPATSEGRTPRTEEPVAPLSYASYRDRDGRGEGWWRSRVAALEEAIRAAALSRDWAYRHLKSGSTLGIHPDDRRRYLDAEAKLERLTAERATLREEARRAGALPGWIRELGSDAGTGEGPEPSAPDSLPVPKQLSPEAGAEFRHFPRQTILAWRSVEGAATYQVEVECLHCCGRGRWCPDRSAEDLTGTQFAFTFVGAQPGRWRVRAVAARGVAGEWSDWREFRFLR